MRLCVDCSLAGGCGRRSDGMRFGESMCWEENGKNFSLYEIIRQGHTIFEFVSRVCSHGRLDR